MTATVERDPEEFCVCGHGLEEHALEVQKKAVGVGKCLAEEPDKCTCRGYRLGKLSKLRGKR